MRIDGYASIRDYALIGDGRTAALVASDGSIDWLAFPNIDSPSVCGALLDADRGGAFLVQPTIPFQSSRRYVPLTNILETTFTTDAGSVRVTDSMPLPDDRLGPMRELARSIEGLSGRVPMRWSFAPRFQYGDQAPHWGQRYGMPVFTAGVDAVAVCHWDAGAPSWSGARLDASFDISAGGRGLVVLAGAYAEPLVFPGRSAVESRVAKTLAFWREWASARTYDKVHGATPCCGALWCSSC